MVIQIHSDDVRVDRGNRLVDLSWHWWSRPLSKYRVSIRSRWRRGRLCYLILQRLKLVAHLGHFRLLIVHLLLLFSYHGFKLLVDLLAFTLALALFPVASVIRQ